VRGDAHAGFGERPGETTESNAGTAPQADSTGKRHRFVLEGRHQCGGAVAASAVVEVLAPGRHDLARLGFGGESP
jgi:hypothetical protein